MISSAFTCTGPYAILILLGIKQVENRSAMPMSAKGRCAISCSKSFCKEEYGEFVRWAARMLRPEDFELIPAWCDVKDWPGKIVGCCDYVASGRVAADPEDLSTPRGEDAACTVKWNEGYPYWWNLSDVVAFDRSIPCRGNVGMWQMPPALAAQVTAADALARSVGVKVSTVEDAAGIFRAAMPIVGGNEGVFVLPLDAERRTLSVPTLVSLGDSTTAVVQPHEMFSAALKVGACAIILAHNHPGGTLVPSREDVELTRRLEVAADLLGIRFLDHLIVTKEGVKSVVSRRN